MLCNDPNMWGIKTFEVWCKNKVLIARKSLFLIIREKSGWCDGNIAAHFLSHDFVVDQLLQLLLAQVVLVFVKVEEFFRNWCGCWLILWVVVRL